MVHIPPNGPAVHAEPAGEFGHRPDATLAIGSTRTVPLFAPGAARPAGNHTVIIEFLVDDVDRAHRNLAGFAGDLVNFFTPVTPAAIEKFAR